MIKYLHFFVYNVTKYDMSLSQLKQTWQMFSKCHHCVKQACGFTLKGLRERFKRAAIRTFIICDAYEHVGMDI